MVLGVFSIWAVPYSLGWLWEKIVPIFGWDPEPDVPTWVKGFAISTVGFLIFIILPAIYTALPDNLLWCN